MDEDIRKVGQSCRQLLGLGGWMLKAVKGGKNGFEANEEKKLELRLGPPGENWPETNGRRVKEHCCDSVLYLNCSSAGSKRGFSDGINPKIEAFEQQQQQQQQKPSFLHLQINPGFEMEMFQRTNGKLEQQQSIEVKACCLPPPESVKAAGGAAVGHSRSRTRPTQVVGWPPIQSFRKSLASTSQQAVGAQLGSTVRVGNSESRRKRLFVKINMEGIPIGRKVDLTAYESYEKLSLAVDELFRDLLVAQMDPLNGNKKSSEKQAISGLLDGSGEYTLVYEDNEGDRMLVGDVPWDMAGWQVGDEFCNFLWKVMHVCSHSQEIACSEELRVVFFLIIYGNIQREKEPGVIIVIMESRKPHINTCELQLLAFLPT